MKKTDRHSRILLIDNDGLSHYTSYLARGLVKYRDITLYGFSKLDYTVTGAAKDDRIKFYWIGKKLHRGTRPVKVIGQSFYLLSELFRALLGKSKYDIVHIQGHLPMFFLFIPFLKIKKKQIYWTLHDVELMPSYGGIKGQIEVLYIKISTQPILLKKYAHVIIVHGLFLKKQLEAKGIDKNKIHVIPHFDYRYLLDHSGNMYHDNQYNVIRRSDNSVFPKEEYILFIGHITPYKGIDILVKAAKIVRLRIQDNRLSVVIAGKGDTSYFDNLLDKGEHESKYIHMLNKYITSSEIPEILSNAKFVVLPYTTAFQYSVSGIIPLAYTFSKPVIVSNVGSLVEYVDHGKTGFVFEAGNVEELADYIIELLKDERKCIEMGKSGHEKMMKEMSLEKCCETINDLYNQKQL
jgi:glycosyltransferase involved in cell wall biosynthesis